MAFSFVNALVPLNQRTKALALVGSCTFAYIHRYAVTPSYLGTEFIRIDAEAAGILIRLDHALVM